MADKAEREVKYTFWLVFSISICVFGNSFLYGYNIGVVNQPAKIIQVFYKNVLLARDGQLPAEDENVLATNQTDLTGGGVGYIVKENGGNTTNQTSVGKKVGGKEEEDPFIELLWSLTVAIFVAFGMIGSFISGNVAEKLGRKRGMIAITVIMLIAAVLGGIPRVASSFEVLIISRAFVGLHCGLNVSLASLYLAEISPQKIRGAVGTCHQLFITIGILWSMILGLRELLGTEVYWPLLFAFNALPALTCLVLMPLCPESPRYLLITKKDEQGATEVMRKLRGYTDVEEEVEEMRVEAKKQQSVEHFSLKQLLSTPELRMPLIIAVFLQAAQQASGINAVMSYSSFIFTQASVAEDVVQYAIVGNGTINVIATIIAVPLMEKAGRRPLLLWPMCCMALSFLLLCIFHTLQYDEDLVSHHSAFAWVCIIAMHTYVIGFALGLGPIPFTIVSEMFRQEPRAAAMSFSIGFNWIINFILMMTFRFMQEALFGFTYIPFIVILVISIIFIFFFVPETKNRTFDDIANSISHGRQKKSPPFNDEEGVAMGPL
ncbi:hypothetical protein ScPMuIL_008219 [Solemya velum]